jgi:hypothetical protein
MIVIDEGGTGGVRTVETILSDAFLRHGFRVLDYATVRTLLERQTTPRSSEDAVRPIVVDMIIVGQAQVQCEQRWSDHFGQEMQESIANMSAKAIKLHSGEEVVSAEVHDIRASADPSGGRALAKAANELASKLGYMIWSRIDPRPACTPTLAHGRMKHKWAVVIGIKTYRYTQYWKPLASAVNDATDIANALKARGFQLLRPPLVDQEATYENIWRLLYNTLPAKVGPNDQVVIFFSGHGHTEHLPDDSKLGYLVPVDGQDPAARHTLIPMHLLQQAVNALCADQILVMLDACFSGLLTHKADDVRFRGWLALVAGQEHERVRERMFTQYVIAGLRGAADANRDRIVTAHELAQYVHDRVPEDSKGQQHPQFRVIGGDPRDFRL